MCVCVCPPVSSWARAGGNLCVQHLNHKTSRLLPAVLFAECLPVSLLLLANWALRLLLTESVCDNIVLHPQLSQGFPPNDFAVYQPRGDSFRFPTRGVALPERRFTSVSGKHPTEEGECVSESVCQCAQRLWFTETLPGAETTCRFFRNCFWLK